MEKTWSPIFYRLFRNSVHNLKKELVDALFRNRNKKNTQLQYSKRDNRNPGIEEEV